MHITCTQTALRVHKNSCTLFISLFKNRLNPIFANTPHRPLYFTKITTTSTAFLTSNTAVSNPYSHSTAFDPQSFASLYQVPGSFNRCASVWYWSTLRPSNSSWYSDLQTDNDIRQCVNISWTGVFKSKFVSMVRILDSLYRFPFQLIKNGSAANRSRSVQKWKVVM